MRAERVAQVIGILIANLQREPPPIVTRVTPSHLETGRLD
jgi:hypothetical protein